MPASTNLALVFDATVASHAERVALDFGGGEAYTYGALGALANQACRLFSSAGARPGDIVALAGEKSIATFAAMLGALKLGAAYSILDPAQPPRRLGRVLENLRPTLLMSPIEIRQAVPESQDRAPFQWIDNEVGPFVERLAELSARPVDTSGHGGGRRAYVMYTSGSTGLPKGAVMSHDNVEHLIRWSREAFGFGPGEVLTNVNPLYFDNSVFDFYSSLFTGATLAPIRQETVARPAALLEAIAETGCTSWFSVPSLLMFLDRLKAFTRDDAFASLRRVIFGGEGYPLPRLQRLFERFGDRLELVNVYGPTECTCIASHHWVTAADFDRAAGLPPLGRLLPGFTHRILDESGGVVAPGGIGELCLLGPQVGLGYHRDPERTAAAFEETRDGDGEGRLYRTGDLVRRDPEDGTFYFHGRIDHQIKHMGYRIELGEIETALAECPGVAEAVAVHRGAAEPPEIVAVLACEASPLAEREIRRHLGERLPAYMVPSRFFFEPVLPKNRNGKIDRVLLADRYAVTSRSEFKTWRK